jgi:poly-gamma-glutamate synthesis protein (capsule biosynthesis protein)
LNEQKILHTGAGKDISDASAPVFCQVKGQKICMIALTDNEPDWEAKQHRPGIFYVPINSHDQKAKNLLKRIGELRKEADFIIMAVHWGGNWGYEPPPSHRVFAHAMIEAGADLIFGHSPHVFRGIEVYQGRPIIYSAGDFIDDYAVDEIERNDESFIFVLEKESQHLKIHLYPSCIDNCQANLSFPHQCREILSKMEKLCQNLGTSIECFQNYASITI